MSLLGPGKQLLAEGPSLTPESIITAPVPKSSWTGSSSGTGVVINSDELLHLYHRDFAREIPFVVVPPEMTAQQLTKEKPCLWLAIIAVTSYQNAQTQKSLGKEVIKYLSDHAILRGEKDLDMLQGILVYTTWCVNSLLEELSALKLRQLIPKISSYNKLFHSRPQLNMLLSLGNSMMVDLGLNLAPFNFGNHELFINEMRNTLSRGSCQDGKGAISLEYMRAVLGTFYLFSCVCTRDSIRIGCHTYTSHRQLPDFLGLILCPGRCGCKDIMKLF